MKKIALISLWLILFNTAAQAATVEHQFAVNLGPFDAGTATFAYTLTPGSYEVRSGMKTAGLFDTLYPFSAKYLTSGKISRTTLEPTVYRYKSKSRFNTRSKELVYDANGTPLYRISTKNGKKKKSAVTNTAETQDATDLQTVFAKLVRQYNEVRFCDSKMRVFDGKRRFDVIFKDEGREELTPAENSPYQGLAAKCSLYVDKLNSKDDDLLWELSAKRPIYFWILEQNGRPFIARILVEDTPLGRLDVYTSQVSVKE